VVVGRADHRDGADRDDDVAVVGIWQRLTTVFTSRWFIAT